MDRWHFFKNNHFAGPGPLDMMNIFAETGGPIRSSIPYKMPTPFSIKKHESVDFLEMSRFWNEYYSGSDWRFHCTPLDVELWIKQGFILVMRDGNKLIGTFVCRKIPGGVICGKPNGQAAILDGLVIHPDYRGKGLASYLMNSMDHEVYKSHDMNRSILIWFREHETFLTTPLQAPISIEDYCYILLEKLPYRVQGDAAAHVAPREMVESLMKAIVSDTELVLSSKYFDEIHVRWFLTKSSIIGILDTHRVTKHGNLPIWEIVFAANLVKPYFTGLQKPIELAASELGYGAGVLFASSGLTRGNLHEPNGHWRSGTSGYLTTHVYNWMPPRFLTGNTMLVNSCI